VSRTPGRIALGYAALCLAGLAAFCWLLLVVTPDYRSAPPAQHKLTAVTTGETVRVGISTQDGPNLIVAPVQLADGRSTWLQVTKPVNPDTPVNYWQRQDTGAILTQPFLGDYWHHNRNWLWLAIPLVALSGFAQYKASAATDAWRRQRQQRKSQPAAAHQM
jgi:hypothetical protein